MGFIDWYFSTFDATYTIYALGTAAMFLGAVAMVLGD